MREEYILDEEKFQNWFSGHKAGIYGDYEHQWDAQYELQPGDVYMEAGGYWGRFARKKASKKVGPEGKVILIEPDPLNARVIQEVVKREKLKNVYLIQCAVWSKRGSDWPFNTKGNFSGHRLLAARKGSLPRWRQEIPESKHLIGVGVDTVDSILRTMGIDCVNLFAADVENAEVEMLKGMEMSLIEKRIKNLAIGAYHSAPHGNYDDVIAILRHYGYEAKRGKVPNREVVYARVKE